MSRPIIPFIISAILPSPHYTLHVGYIGICTEMQAAITELEAKVVIAEQRVARAEEEEGARISPLFKVG